MLPLLLIPSSDASCTGTPGHAVQPILEVLSAMEPEPRLPPPTVDTASLPGGCYAGEDCAGSLQLEGDGWEDAQVWLTSDSAALPLERDGSGWRVPLERDAPGTVRWGIELRQPGEETVIIGEHTVSYTEPLQLEPLSDIDFGAIPAGTPAAHTCQSLTLTGSGSPASYRYRIEPVLPASGCAARPVILQGDRAVSLPRDGVDLSGPVEVCLSVPACEGESVAGAGLRIVPQSQEFADRGVQLGLSWQVVERSWLSCNQWWLSASGGGLLFVGLLLGWARPARFPPEATVRTAGSLKGLRRAHPQRLRECRGARPGFYRDAAVGVHGDGQVTGRRRGGAVRLCASRVDGVRLEGAAEIMSRRSRKWEPVSEEGVSSGAVYRVGDLWFQIDL